LKYGSRDPVPSCLNELIGLLLKIDSQLFVYVVDHLLLFLVRQQGLASFVPAVREPEVDRGYRLSVLALRLNKLSSLLAKPRGAAALKGLLTLLRRLNGLEHVHWPGVHVACCVQDHVPFLIILFLFIIF